VETNFLRFEFEVMASAILNETVSSDFLLLALPLIQELGSSSFLTEAELYFRRADSIVPGIPATQPYGQTKPDDNLKHLGWYQNN
jgi:hypothetical protein